MSLEAKKLNVVQLILSIDNEEVIDEINTKVIELIPSEGKSKDDMLLAKYTGRLEEHVNLNKIMKEQNYQGIDIDKMERLAKEANIEESIDDLLEMLD